MMDWLQRDAIRRAGSMKSCCVGEGCTKSATPCFDDGLTINLCALHRGMNIGHETERKYQLAADMATDKT